MSEVKVKYYCFSLRTNYFCIIESIDAFSFVNGVIAYKAFLVKEKGNKVVYKIFIANVVSMHLSATNSGLFKGHGLGYPGGLLLRGGGGVVQIGEKAQGCGGGGFKNVRAPCIRITSRPSSRERKWNQLSQFR